MGHCEDNQADRKLGNYWERQFCKMAAQYSFMFTPMQIKHQGAIQAFNKTQQEWNHFTLPDVTIWTAPGQHHEIKHKCPTRYGTFGLEAYRFYALLKFAHETKQDVLYTIHNHALSGGRESKFNTIEHWLTANVLQLNETWIFEARLPSWVDGKRKIVLQYFWPVDLWIGLANYWQRHCDINPEYVDRARAELERPKQMSLERL